MDDTEILDPIEREFLEEEGEPEDDLDEDIEDFYEDKFADHPQNGATAT